MNMSVVNILQENAILAIREHGASELARLRAVAAEARHAHEAAVRRAFAPPDGASDALRAVLSLCQATVMVGREDGFPAVSLPKETIAVLRAASAAGVVTSLVFGDLDFYGDFSGARKDVPEWHADYAAWSAAKDYAARNT
jgi:hypothetical protein